MVSEAFGDLKAPIKMVSPPHVPVPFARSLEEEQTDLQTVAQQLTETTTTEQFAPQAEPYPEMLANFADAILHGTPLTAPGVEGVRALELTDAAYLSAWLGEKLTLPLDADRFEQELQKHIQEEQTNG